MPVLSASLDEARENLRVIRQTMDRSTKYSTLSGLSGVLIGIVAIIGVLITYKIHTREWFSVHSTVSPIAAVAAVWGSAMVLAIAIEFLANKRRAARVGKHLASRLGAHIIIAAIPGFLAGGVLTCFFALHGLIYYVWGIWMICYGLAICAVGLFSVRPVSMLGASFVTAGAITLLLPLGYHLPMMAVTFGGFHIIYGIAMARRHGW